MMIDNANLKLKRDKYQWVLSLPSESIGKAGQPVVTWRDSYHSTLNGVSNHICHDIAGGSSCLKALSAKMLKFTSDLETVLSNQEAKGENS